MMHVWYWPILWKRREFTAFLQTLPNVTNLRIIGIESGRDGSEQMDLGLIFHYNSTLDYKAKLRGLILADLPKAKITFERMKDANQAWSL